MVNFSVEEFVLTSFSLNPNTVNSIGRTALIEACVSERAHAMAFAVMYNEKAHLLRLRKFDFDIYSTRDRGTCLMIASRIPNLWMIMMSMDEM